MEIDVHDADDQRTIAMASLLINPELRFPTLQRGAWFSALQSAGPGTLFVLCVARLTMLPGSLG